MDKAEAPPSVNSFDAALLEWLGEPTKDLLVQMLLHESTLTGSTFRMLAQREPPELRDALLLVSRETLTETAAAVRMRQWDAHPVAWDTMMDCTSRSAAASWRTSSGSRKAWPRRASSSPCARPTTSCGRACSSSPTSTAATPT